MTGTVAVTVWPPGLVKVTVDDHTSVSGSALGVTTVVVALKPGVARVGEHDPAGGVGRVDRCPSG